MIKKEKTANWRINFSPENSVFGFSECDMLCSIHLSVALGNLLHFISLFVSPFVTFEFRN